MTPIVYQDFELRIELIPGTDNRYRVDVINSPSGDARGEFGFPFSDQELEKLRYTSLPKLETIQEFGRTLFNSVFADKVETCLRRSLDAVRGKGQGLRLRLRLNDAPALADLPWEFLYDLYENGFLITSADTLLVRYLELSGTVSPLAVPPPIKILVMIATPREHAYGTLNVEEEWLKVKNALFDLEQLGLVQVTCLKAATLNALRDQLLYDQYHIFHFVGHGDFDQQTQSGALRMEDDKGRSYMENGHRLSVLLRDHHSLRLAFLNACEGARTGCIDIFNSVAPKLVRCGIPAVIAMQFEITDEAAITLAHKFYTALAKGYPVDTALAEARQIIFISSNGVEWGTPVLYLRAKDGQIFEVTDQHQASQPEQYQIPGLQLKLLRDGYTNWHKAQNEWFQRRLRDEATSRTAFKQILNVADSQVKLVERQTLWDTLDTWFAAWHKNKIFVLLGEEGDGKTWGVAAWLNQKIATDETFSPVVFLPSADVAANDPRQLLLQAINPHDVSTSLDDWQQSVAEWFVQPLTDNPTLLLVLDGINERREFAWWRQLLEGISGDEYCSNLVVIVTCRTEYWQRTFSKLSHLQTTSFTLQSYDDNELRQALDLNGLNRSEFSAELLQFMRKPRYFDLAVIHRNRLGAVENITIARLIYEDWQDRWKRKSKIPITDEEFRDLLRLVAEKQEKRTRSVKKYDFDSILDARSSEPLDLLEELRTGKAVIVNEGRVQLNERLLVLGLGLLLVDQLIDAWEDTESDLIEVAAKWLEPNAGMDIKAQICEMAALHALLVPEIAEEIKVTLLLVWVSSQNPGQDVQAVFAAYMSDNIATFVVLCKYLWSEDFDNRWAQDVMVSAFIHCYPRSRSVSSELKLATERWLGMVHVAGFPSQRGNKLERTEEVKAQIAQRVGFTLQLGDFTYAGRTLTAIDDDNLLRLGRAALAIISHFPRGPFVHSIATGCVAEAIMDRPDKYELFRWVLSTAPESVGAEVQHEVARLLTFDSTVTQQAASRLLSFEGSKQAHELGKILPSDLFPEHFLHSEYKKDPCLSWFAWSKETCEICLQRTYLEAQYIARRMETHALDPLLTVPDELQKRFAELAETISIDQIWSTMFTGVQDLAFEQFEPALCAVAPQSIGNVIRQIVQTTSGRSELALRQISFRLREHALLFEQEEMQSIYQAWQLLCQSAETWQEEQEMAEMMLFAPVLLNLNAEQQLAHLLQRPNAGSDLLQYENYFLPIQDWVFVEDLLQNITDERSLLRFLWFISVHAKQIPSGFLFACVMSYVESPSAQVRRLVLQIIHNSQNRYLGLAVVGGWRRDLNNLDEENSLGSLILCKYGSLLTIEDLCQRVDPSYWGDAIQYRGNHPSEVDYFAEKIHTLWQHISNQTNEVPQNLPQTTIDISTRANLDSAERSMLSISNENQKRIQWRASDQTWGGSDDNRHLYPVFPTDEEINEQRARDVAIIQAMKDQEIAAGNPWFARRFTAAALEHVVVKHRNLLEQWLQAVSKENSQRLRTLQRCHSFYEALCVVLLQYSLEKGVTLYTQMARVNLLSRDARTRWQFVDQTLFRTNPVGVIDELWKKKLQACTTDAQLLTLASMLQSGAGKEWLWTYIEQQLESNTPLGISRGITLWGYYDSDIAQERLNELFGEAAPDTWSKQLLEKSIHRWHLNAWSRHWFSRIFSSETNVDAWAALRLFLRCVDSRFWIWYEQTKESCSVYPDFERRRQHIEINWETIRNRIRKNEDSFEKQLFGQKILQNQTWPWM